MMELVRLGLINWYLASREDIDVAGNIAILGKNRSGKSSLLDMAQVVLTGYNKSVQRLNASAGDGKHKKSERSIFAYCQGTYGDGNTVRAHGTTIIFLAFQDPQTDRAITIGIAFEFDAGDTAERLLGRFIVPGAVLSTELFIQKTIDPKTGKPGEKVKDWATIKTVLEHAAKGKSCGTIFDSTSESFIKNWTKLASTGRRSISPARLMKALVNAISFEEIQSATQFVRDYVLAKDPLDIAQLKTSIKTYHDLHKKIIDLKEQLAVADDIIGKVHAHARLVKHRDDMKGAASALAYASARSIYFVNFNGARKQRALEAKLALEIAGLDKEIATVNSDLDDVQDLINAAYNNADRLILNQQKKNADLEKGYAEKALNELYNEATRLVREANRASRHEPLGAIQNPLAGIAQSLQTQHPNWPKDISAVLDAVEQIGSMKAATIAKLQARLEQEARQRTKIEDRLQEIREAIENLRAHGVVISTQTSRFLNALKSRGIDPKILCQLIEVTDESWRDAAEMMLGKDREAIIVDARHATQAKAFLRTNRADFMNVRVVGTDKEDWKDSHHRPDSLAAIIETDHPDARILVDKRLGNLRRADDIEGLRRAGRAVLRDGTYDDGIAVEPRRIEGGRKIGKGATDGPSLESEGGQLEAQLVKMRGIEADLRGAISALNAFSAYDRAKTDGVITAYGLAVEKAAEIIAKIKDLDANIDPKLAERKSEVQTRIDSLSEDRRNKEREQAKAGTKAESYEEKLGESELIQGSRAHVALKRKDFRHTIRFSDPAEAFRLAREIAGKVSRNGLQLLNASNQASSKADEAKERADKTESLIFDQIMDFNGRWQSASHLSRAHSKVQTDVLPYFQNLAKQIRESDLVAHEQLAKDAAESTRGMFQTAFVASLSDKITRLGDEVDRLNRILAEHKFHEERYSFRAVKAAQYEELIDFVKQAREDDSLMLKVLDPDAAEETGAAGAINRILMDENFDFSGFEDYRQYFTFDILMRNDAEQTLVNLEKRKGIGSGAERQVPFYVAIGAALSAAWHGSKAEREKNAAGIGLALFDEAFSKMDSSNQRACIQFYNSLGLQTVIAAPSQNQAVALANMNTIVNVSRDGRHVEFDITKVKGQTHAAIAANDPASLTAADVRAMLAARAAAAAAAKESSVNGDISGHLNGSIEPDMIVNGSEAPQDIMIAEALPVANPEKLEDLKP